MRTVDHDADEVVGEGRIERLPQRVRDALGELAGAAKEGLLALSVGVGLGVLHELMEAEVDEVVGPKGRHDPDRVAVRHGHQDGEVTLGGRRVPVSRPRARTVDGEREVGLDTYAHFAERDQLADVMLERMLAGVSTRRYARTGEPVGTEIDEVARSTSKSAVSREFVSRTRENLIELMSQPLDDLRLVVVMLDGIELKGRCCVVALGIDTDGVKHPLGLWDGSTENATVATTLLSNLTGRGLDIEQGVLVVLDGGTALRKAVNDVFGVHTPVQRCVRHKERNVLDHLPEHQRDTVRRRLRGAWALDDHDQALDRLRVLADELARTDPGAAASLREGLEETLTITRLGVTGRLKLTLQSTNPCESMIETVRRISRNVKRWHNGDMCLRWTAAGMLEARQQFRRIIGHTDLTKLAVAVENDVATKQVARITSQPLNAPPTAAPEVTATAV
ncbi:MAG TPA: IS256 family transposase [Solirubrobacteraceae bacterium]|nr:IS256 family transposase [Solirubrobacteraceae bacterium]